MRVVLAGASGLIGTALKQSLQADGHQVGVLLRRPDVGDDVDSWDPAQGLVDPNFLADAEAVVCLSGVGVGDHRWTDSHKQQIVSSRVDTVGTLARSLAEYGGPRVLIAASAVGYYGDTGNRIVEEDAAPGTSFLAEVCVRWEAAADPAREAGVRVTHLRTGIVLSGDGGLVKQIKPIVQLGVAGRIGTGRQYLPWISLRDEVRAIRFLIEHEVHGPANLTAPRPATNAEFMTTFGHVLHRPTVLPAPAFALKAVVGEFAGEILGGQRAVPKVLTDAGFEFEHTELESALRWSLNR